MSSYVEQVLASTMLVTWHVLLGQHEQVQRGESALGLVQVCCAAAASPAS